MPRIVVFGYGNPVREDDGLGWRAAELLKADRQLEVHCCQQLTPELAETVADASSVIFLDAAVGQPGTIQFCAVHPEESVEWTHHLTPGQLLRLTERLKGTRPAAFLITGGASRTGYGETLSPEGERVADRMAAFAAVLIRTFVDHSIIFERGFAAPTGLPA